VEKPDLNVAETTRSMAINYLMNPWITASPTRPQTVPRQDATTSHN